MEIKKGKGILIGNKGNNNIPLIIVPYKSVGKKTNNIINIGKIGNVKEHKLI